MFCNIDRKQRISRFSSFSRDFLFSFARFPLLQGLLMQCNFSPSLQKLFWMSSSCHPFTGSQWMQWVLTQPSSVTKDLPPISPSSEQPAHMLTFAGQFGGVIGLWESDCSAPLRGLTQLPVRMHIALTQLGNISALRQLDQAKRLIFRPLPRRYLHQEPPRRDSPCSPLVTNCTN